MGETEDPNAIAAQIGDARRAKRLTQQQLADAVGVDRKTVNRWENGRTHGLGANYAKLAEALGWPADQALRLVQGNVVVLTEELETALHPQSRYLARSAPTAADDPDPLEAKLERLQLLAHGLNPADLRRLADSVQLLLEWVDGRQGVPEMTAEEQAQLEGLQRATNAHNRAMRNRETHAADAVVERQAGRS